MSLLDQLDAAWAKTAHPQVGVQTLLPLHGRRPLSPAEEAAVAAGQSRWLPRIFQSYGTPVPELMSSPGKGAVLYGLGGGGLGAVGGGLLGSSLAGHDPKAQLAGAALGALAGGLGGGGLAALLGYKTRQADNEGLVELMKRLPPNATVRDLLSDPVYNQDTAALPADAARLAATFRGIRQGLGPPPPADY